MKKFHFILLLLSLSSIGFAQDSMSKNDQKGYSTPFISGIGMADPHIHIFNDRAYLFSTRDIVPSQGWNMPDWQIWSSDDLVNWKKELTILPTDTYIGDSQFCFAPDAATKNDKYYFYFSNHIHDSGVMVADQPEGPYKDALGKPLLPKELTDTHEYDISVPVDDDGEAYIIFGTHNYKSSFYHIAKLNPDMISLAEKPKPITITGEMRTADKPNVHKHNGKYYLSVGANYAISDNIYGPYESRWSSEDDFHPYGWNQRAHGNFFDWNNQSFYTWCRHVRWDPAIKRESRMTYVHYKENGDMVYDEELLDKHLESGVGQYSADWDKIQAEWYMKATNVNKKESPNGGFEIQDVQNNGSLYFPNVSNLKNKKSITFHASSMSGGIIQVRNASATGTLLGACTIPKTGNWTSYQSVTCDLSNLNGVEAIYLKFVGTDDDIMHLDWLKFNNSVEYDTAQSSSETSIVPKNQTPYSGSRISIPGKVEAEHYDLGGEGVAYHDSDSANRGENIREGGVDILGIGKIHAVVHTMKDEWLEYSVDVKKTGRYAIDVTYSTGKADAKLNADLTDSNIPLFSNLELPITKSWADYETVTAKEIKLKAGKHILRFTFPVGGLNLDSCDFRLISK